MIIPGYTLVLENGYYKARKIGISGDRVKTDPAFALTRMQAAEFGQMAKMGKLIRSAFLNDDHKMKNAHVLTRLLLKALSTDSVNYLGSRSLAQADLSALVGFNFNIYMPLYNGCKVPFQVKENPGVQQVIVEVPPFIPCQEIEAIGTASVYKLRFRLVRLHPEHGITSSVTRTMQGIPLDPKTTPACTHIFDAAIATGEIMLLGVTIEWYTIVNKTMVRNSPYATTILYAKSSCT